MREYGRTVKHDCTFVFSRQVVRRNEKLGHHYDVGSLGSLWNLAMRRSGLSPRKAYQHDTPMRAGHSNPTFIASQMVHSSAQMVHTVYGA